MDRTILTQKIKNPQTKEWIETFYINQKTENGINEPPRIYYKGILADPKAVASRNIDWGTVLDVTQISGDNYRLRILNT